MSLPENSELLHNLDAQREYLRNLYGSATIEIRPSVLVEQTNLLHVFETGDGKVRRIAMGRFIVIPFTVPSGRNQEKILRRVVKFIPENSDSEDFESADFDEPEEPKTGFFKRIFG